MKMNESYQESKEAGKGMEMPSIKAVKGETKSSQPLLGPVKAIKKKQEQEMIGAIQRKKLLLEHVMMERHLGQPCSSDGRQEPSKKVLTNNFANSPFKTSIDINFIELERKIK
mmetsp:Transcript_23442/g.23086  ORF Transcript_23442/g.23086 Transcript_23442/m.23086 type:complete len:113 (+) Transcript_23442:1545-1883(+)